MSCCIENSRVIVPHLLSAAIEHFQNIQMVSLSTLDLCFIVTIFSLRIAIFVASTRNRVAK